MSPAIGAFVGVLLTGGAVLLWVSFQPAPQRAHHRNAAPFAGLRYRLGLTRTDLRLAGAAALVGLLAAAITGWFSAVILLPLILVVTRKLLAPPREAAAIERIEAIGQWVRVLRSLVSSGAGLTEACVASLRSTPDAIRPETEELVARLQARRPAAESFYRWADAIDDPVGDAVASALILASQQDTQGLSLILEQLATTLTRKVRSRLTVEGARRTTRAQARVLSMLIPAAFALFVLFTEFGRAYASPGGQVMLLLVAAAFLGCLWWMHARAATPPPPRFLVTPQRTEQR